MHYADFASKQAALDFCIQVEGEGYTSYILRFSEYRFQVRYWGKK